MPHILLDKTHPPIIQAAINLGDWLLTLENLSDEDKSAIKAVQDALKKLPEIDEDILAMYGFSIERGDADNGLVRGWDVSLEYAANDAEQQVGLEVFSSYIPLPDTTDAAVLAEKKQREVYFHWPVGDICSFIKAEQAQQWIADVSQPLQFIEAGDRLRIEIVYQQFYVEHEYPLS
ncbi:hypothetical protein [Methylophaga sp.]|jgi:hypothetical protein|uniref:hypothetical protein n=1 Tax=Methylophaga sp. TaxID=2024840 RepID=UPI002725BFE9|nr:hypothetical protein [Methylophaga sp.]MDO8825016.1 hypothetical protein [Methylophaga sp.]